DLEVPSDDFDAHLLLLAPGRHLDLAARAPRPGSAQRGQVYPAFAPHSADSLQGVAFPPPGGRSRLHTPAGPLFASDGSPAPGWAAGGPSGPDAPPPAMMGSAGAPGGALSAACARAAAAAAAAESLAGTSAPPVMMNRIASSIVIGRSTASA